MTGMKDIAILGAGGFTGKELIKVLSRHPHLRIAHVTSNQFDGKKLGEVFPELDGLAQATFRKHEDPIPPGVPVFLATPNDTSLALVPELIKKGHRVVDLSGAFRLHDATVFERFYKLKHTAMDLMPKVVFGIPEIFRAAIKNASVVSNPGCYPTGSILPMYILGTARKEIAAIVIDAKSGISGAGGRTEDAGFSFNSVHENFRAYKVLEHQHEPEIREYGWHQSPVPMPPLFFTPHLLPLFRGILSTIAIVWKAQAPSDLEEKIRAAVEKEPFVRFRARPEEVTLAGIQETNYLDIGLRSEGNRTVIVTALDNLLKGAAGQAVQNLNIMLDLPETAGLAHKSA